MYTKNIFKGKNICSQAYPFERNANFNVNNVNNNVIIHQDSRTFTSNYMRTHVMEHNQILVNIN